MLNKGLTDREIEDDVDDVAVGAGNPVADTISDESVNPEPAQA